MPVSTPEEKNTVFVSKARGLKISGFVKEKKQAGHIDQPEEYLEFNNHLLTTSDKKEIKFIEDSLEFKANRIKIFTDVSDAMRYRAIVEKQMATEQEGEIGTEHKEDVKFEGQPAEIIAAGKIPKQ